MLKRLIRQNFPGEKQFIRRFYDALPLYDFVNISCTESRKDLEVLPPFIELHRPLRLSFQVSTPRAPAIDVSNIKELTGDEYSPAEAGLIKSFLQRWHWENSFNLLNTGLLSARFTHKYAYFTDLDKSRLMANCDVVIDVGSYIGLVSLKALALGKEVFAIEAQSDIAEIASTNIENNIAALACEARYEVFNVLVAGKGQSIDPVHEGNQALYAISSDARVESERSAVKVRIGDAECLDLMLAGSLKNRKIFLCLEINGNEVAALSGATEILSSAARGSSCRFPITYPLNDLANLEKRLEEAKRIFEGSGWRFSARRASGKGYFVAAAKL